MANRSRASGEDRAPEDAKVPEAPVLPPFPGTVTKDAPAPLEQFWRQRLPNQHAIPYDHLTVRKSLRLYDAMDLDETISYAQRLKVTARMSSGFSIAEPKDKDGEPLPGSEAVADHIREQMERWDRVDEFLGQMLNLGTKYGYVLGEIVTKDGTIGGKPAWTIDDVLVRNSRFYAFDVSPSGRLLADGVLEFIDPNPDASGIVQTWSPAATARHSPEKFVRWTYSAPDSNAYGLYGRSDYHAAYRGYFLSDNLLKGLGETLDTYKHPIAIAVAKPGLTDTQRTDFLNAMVTGLKRKAIVIPGEYLSEGADLEKAVRFHEVTGKAEDFIKGLGYLDKAKLRALLVGELVAETGSEGNGSYALGKQHVSIFLKIMSWIGKSLSVALCSGLFKKLVRWNLGEAAVELAPTLVWHAAGDAETLERAEIVKTLINAMVIDPREAWVREYVGQFPKIDKDIQAQREEEAEKRLEAETRPPPAAGGPPKGKAATLAAGAEPLAGEADEDEAPVERAPFHEERMLDRTGMAEELDGLIERSEDAWYREWAKVFDGPGGVMAWGRVALRGTRDPALAPRLEGLERSAVAALAEAFVIGAIDALADVRLRLAESGFGRLEVEELAARKAAADVPLDVWARARWVRLRSSMHGLAGSVSLPRSVLDRAADKQMRLIRENLASEKKRLIDEAKAAVARARSAKGRAARQEDLRKLRARWRGVDRDLANNESALIETMLNKAYNDGVDALVDALPAGTVVGWLYSAIRDSHTTEFCRAWDGYRAPKNHPVWRRVTPPNHWRCRSKRVPILVGETTDAALAAAAKRQPRVEKPGGGLRWP